jgi:UDP-glucose 4-epimerase
LSECCKLAILRPSNVYGPGQHFNKGMGIIPHLIDLSQSGGSLVLYETDNSERDYLYINDFISAINIFIEEEFSTGIYNVSSGINISLKDIIEHVNAVFESNIDYMIQQKIPANFARISSTKMLSLFKWNAYTNIRDGLYNTKKWFEQ